MSDSGSPSASAAATPRSPHHTLKVVGGIALVLAIGGGAYGIAMSVDNGATSAPTTPTTTSPGGPPGGGAGRGAAIGRTPATRPQATGTVQTVGSSSFVVKTAAGTTVTVRVSARTTYSDAPSGAASYSDVKTGTRVAAYGTLSGSTVTATRVVVVPAGAAGGFRGGFGGSGGAGTFGTVKSVGSESFVISTFSGSTVTVDVSTSTTYSERGSTSASFSDLKAGVRVAVQGSGTSTVSATEVLILPAGNFRGGAGGGFGGAGGGGGGFGGGTVSG